MGTTTIKYFAFEHLPLHLQTVSKPIGELARIMEDMLPDGPEKSAGMRKLLEAKDCFVRSAIDAPKQETASSLQPHQQRVVAEKAELDEKISKLRAFLNRPTIMDLPKDERDRLTSQLSCMDGYSSILGQRIASFN